MWSSESTCFKNINLRFYCTNLIWKYFPYLLFCFSSRLFIRGGGVGNADRSSCVTFCCSSSFFRNVSLGGGVSRFSNPIAINFSVAFWTLLSEFERMSKSKVSSALGNTLFRYLSKYNTKCEFISYWEQMRIYQNKILHWKY